MFDQNLRLKPSIRSLECSKTFKPPASRTPKVFHSSPAAIRWLPFRVCILVFRASVLENFTIVLYELIQ